METRAAILFGRNQEWSVSDITLDPPRTGEVLVEWRASGLCHSDEHLVTGDIVPPDEFTAAYELPPMYPIIGGHEGAGVVLEVGPGVTTLAPGDRVAASFLPSCGRCRWCVTGHTNLCDLGAETFTPGQIGDGTDRHHFEGEGIAIIAKLGTFAHHSVVHEASLVKFDEGISFEAAALVSCGVTTGFGSAVTRAEVAPGDVVVVVGIGGVGINAVQGARVAGAKAVMAVDPVEFKRKAALDFGATHTAASMVEALPEVIDLTLGQKADSVILAPSVLHGELLAEALNLIGKNGTCVVTALAPITQTQASIDLFELAMWQKEVRGVIFGAGNPRFDIPNLLELYKAGILKLDELVTKTYPLERINDGYEDLRQGRILRGLLELG